MGLEELQQRLLNRYRIRVEAEMGQYLLRQIARKNRGAVELPVIGGESRTGMPLRLMINPADLLVSDEISRPAAS